MKMTLTIAKAAEINLRKAFIWYEEKEARLGLRFEESVEVIPITDNQ